MTIPKRNILLHTLGIIVFLILPIMLSPTPKGLPMFNFTGPTIRDLLSGILMIVFFYANYYFLVPKLFLKKKYLIYSLLIIVFLSIITVVPSLLLGHIPWGGSNPPPIEAGLARPKNDNFLFPLSHNIILFLAVVTFSIFLRVQERLFKVEKAKNQMEILSLKEQINPHFLFNTLNNIYGQAIEDDSFLTASSILKLSEMLRYVVHETQHQWVTIGKEMAYLENYIQLQRQRLGDNTDLTYKTEGDFSKSYKIAPLILIPFIENAFKHGINPDRKSFINILVSIHANILSLLVENMKARVQLQAHEESGAGMKITLERLNMLYPDRYELQIEDTDSNYIVHLKLELHDQSDSP